MNEREFSRYFRRMFPRLVTYARRTVDPETAQDLAARALESLWVKDVPDPVDADEWQQLDGLTFAILRGLVRNETRAEKRRRFLVDKMAHHQPPTPEPPVPSGPGTPAWFLALPPADQEVLGLVAEGYSAGEIAGIVGSTPAAVRKRVSRARQKMRDLARRGGSAEDA